MPDACTFRARRLIPAIGIITGETEPHRHNGDAPFVIERLAVDPKPRAQTRSRPVVIGNAAVVDTNAWSLARDAEPRGFADAQYRPHAIDKLSFTDAAGADFGEQVGKVGFGLHSKWMSTIRVVTSRAALCPLAQNVGNIPTTAPVIPEASVPATRDFKASSTTSCLRSGTIPEIPAIMMPTEPRLANPHMA